MNKQLFRRFWLITIPIIIQNGITNFVSLLDNIMVGSIGTLEMSGVSIVNQLMLVFNITMFGCAAGAGIFTAQFHGSQDARGIRHTMRFKLLACTVVGLICIGIFFFFSDTLIGLFLKGEGAAADAAATAAFGKQYLYIMLLGLLPFAINNAYATTLRECGKSFIPMVGGIVAVFVNLIGNYLLIYGHLGLPRLGVTGAAIATVISRFVELGIVVIWTHAGSALPAMKGLYRSFHIPHRLFRKILIKGSPLLVNEILFSSGEAFMNQIYSTRGLDVVPALNIATTIYSLLNVVVLAMAHSTGIYIGQMMGAGHTKQEVRKTCNKLLLMCLGAGVIFCLALILISGWFPSLYNTTTQIRALAGRMICVCGVYLIFISYINPVYFVLRSGGNTWSSFVFDCGFSWLISIPVALVLSNFTELPIVPLFALCRGASILKCVYGYFMLRRGTWIRNLANE